MFAHTYRSPYGGTTIARSTEPSGGCSTKLTSLCQLFARGAPGGYWMACTCGLCSGPGIVGCPLVTGPNRSPNANQALGLEVLTAEEHDPVLEQRGADLLDRVVVDVGGEVDAGDLGADATGDGTDVDIRGCSWRSFLTNATGAPRRPGGGTPEDATAWRWLNRRRARR